MLCCRRCWLTRSLLEVNISAPQSTEAKVLGLFLAASGGHLSGQEISRRLDMSRTAIWKHVQSLRRAGYLIESSPRLGYRLLARPDRLLPAEVHSGLRAQVLGRDLHHLETATSTQEVASRMARAGAPEGTVVVAEEQTAARGRLGRHYFTPRGGIWFSAVLRPPLIPQEVPLISLLAGIAVAEAVAEETGLPVQLKWPNDVLIRGRKAVGILTELAAEAEAVAFILCGIGINVNQRAADFPEPLRATATSLREELGREVPRASLFRCVLEKLDRYYQSFLQQGPAPVLEVWRRLPNILGERVRVATGKESLEGVALGLDRDGALLLQLADGSLNRVLAGDVERLRAA
ncbi:MAG: biotin--[acetyl-CoA-carboxylase] ligase [Chloroflexi bacterium]|nr:biotin--[acetyl-CoA-carboxylase] ligase [Chloroflexota bacterium]